jgi:hypothetical protein
MVPCLIIFLVVRAAMNMKICINTTCILVLLNSLIVSLTLDKIKKINSEAILNKYSINYKRFSSYAKEDVKVITLKTNALG